MYHILFFHQLIVIFIVSSFWLAWMMLLWRFAYRFLCGHMLWFPLGIYLGVELLDHLVTVLEELPNCFQSGYTILHLPAAYEGSRLSTSLLRPLSLSLFCCCCNYSSECEVVPSLWFWLLPIFPRMVTTVIFVKFSTSIISSTFTNGNCYVKGEQCLFPHVFIQWFVS